MTLQLEISSETQSQCNEERYIHPLPTVARRMEALWLKSHGLPHHLIATLVGVSENTVRTYFEWYQTGGIGHRPPWG